MNPYLAICGHDTCDPYPRRNSVLGQVGDVVLYHDCDGVRHVFRDGHDDGLVLTATETGWALTRERHVETDGRWAMVADEQPVCTGRMDGNDWAAYSVSGRRIVRADTLYGCIARAARHYLRTKESAMQYPLDPYVTECAAALAAAGLEVAETWTEATDPVDHNIAVKVRASTLVLIWDEQRQWTWIVYPSPSSTYSAAGALFADTSVRRSVADVAAEVARLTSRPIFG